MVLINAIINNELNQQIEIGSNNEKNIFRIIKHSIKNLPGFRLVLVQEITGVKQAEALKESGMKYVELTRINDSMMQL